MKIFLEEQKFTQPLVVVGLSIAFILVGTSILKEWERISQGSLSEIAVDCVGLILITLVILLFFILKLKTRINEKGIYYQYYPLHRSYTLISWKEISNCTVRNYDAISEYGGWGIKFSFFKKRGKSFTVKGNTGLQLELKSGKKILLGTQLKEDLQRTIDNYQYKLKTNEI